MCTVNLLFGWGGGLRRRIHVVRELNLLVTHLRELRASITSQLRLADKRLLLLIALDGLTIWKLPKGRAIKIVVLKLNNANFNQICILKYRLQDFYVKIPIVYAM